MRDPRYWDGLYSEHAGFWGLEDHVLDGETRGLAPGRALDLGCGTGANAIKLAGRGWDVVAVDWSAVALRTLRREAEKRGERVRCVVGDITSWTSRVSFDLVVCLYAVPEGGGRRLLLENASSLLSPGGVLLVTDWDVSMAPRWSCAEGELTTPEEIASLLRGLAVERAEVRSLRVLTPENDPLARGDESANVVVVRARKPGREAAGPKPRSG